MPTKPTRAVAYLRLSRVTDNTTSPERQLDACKRYAESRELELVEVCEDIDVSASVARLDRPGLTRARELVRDGKADLIIVWRLDRLARSVGDFSTLLDEGVDVASATEPLDTSSPMGRAMAQVLQVFAELEAKTISARVTSSMAYLAANGRHSGGRPPFGWQQVPHPDGAGFALVPHPQTGPLLREAVDRVLAGESLYSIGADWERRGITAGRGDTSWRANRLSRILRAPLLAGLRTHRGELVRDSEGLPIRDEHSAIITLAERSRLLAALDGRRRPDAPRSSVGGALLSGMLRCLVCGSGALHSGRYSNGARPDVYLCDCGKNSLIMSWADERVSREFLEAFGSWPETRDVLTEPLADNAQLAAVEEAIRDTTDSMREADPDELPELIERLTSLRSRRDQLRSAPAAPSKIERVETGRTIREAWDESEVGYRRALLTSAIELVTVARGTRGHYRDDRVNVIWRP